MWRVSALPRERRHWLTRPGMAPPGLCYTRAQPRRLVSAPAAVARSDVTHVPPCACLAPKPAAAPFRRVPLSALDTFLFVRLLQIPVAYFYRGTVDADALAASLARTLERFPILAGASAAQCIMPPMRGACEAIKAHGAELTVRRHAPPRQAACARRRTGPRRRRARRALPCAATLTWSSTTRASPSTCKRTGLQTIARCLALTWRDGSFNCDGGIADFDGFADWSVVDRNTQPIDNTTPPVRSRGSNGLRCEASGACKRRTSWLCGRDVALRALLWCLGACAMRSDARRALSQRFCGRLDTAAAVAGTGPLIRIRLVRSRQRSMHAHLRACLHEPPS